ncbi:MAG: DNA polymerase III subunit alpha [Rhodospirillales bacterium]
MSQTDFVHLRVHSAYSLLEGAIKLKDLVARCAAMEMPAVGVCDSANLFGALEFANAAKAVGLQPIVGCQVPISREGEADRRQMTPPDPEPLVLLVQSEVGYRNLMALISKAYLETEPPLPPQIALDDLEGHSEGLICLTGGPQGALARLLCHGQEPAARALAQRLAGLFPGRCYIELQRHGRPEEAQSEPGLLDLAYELDVPLVATNEAFFSEAGVYEAHDALLCVAEGAYVSQDERRRLTPEHRLKTAAEMRALFADLPEACDNSVIVAKRCHYFPGKVKPILPAFPTEAGRDEEAELRAVAEAGLEERLVRQVFTEGMSDAERERAAEPYRRRLQHELGVIVSMGFPGYFLIVADFIRWAKEQGIPVGPGRGSGAGSVVAWSLTITDLDPLRWGLLFERFLNPERVSMPDFDIDFCQDRRDEVIRYVQQKYGNDRVAQIITFGKLQARAVLRDVGRVLQMPYGQIDKLCKLVPNNPANPVTLKQAIDGEPQLQAQIESDETVAHLTGIALQLEGLYRHASTHAAGVVIGDRPLQELIPLYRDPRSDMRVTQFNMKFVEEAGLVKFDFLGLKTLTVLAEAEILIRRRDPAFDLNSIPLDDEPTYAMLTRAETVGVFQLESSGMRDVLKRLRPDRFEDIIAVVALYRPGPMDNIPAYIRRKHGEEEPDYLHPMLEGILKETYGIMIYQEQVMQIAQELSGYSLGGADLLRRAMGKKIKAEMDAQKKAFIDGATSREVAQAQADKIFDQVAKFAGYGFNKSHAAAYALVAYQTAYLKARYPVEFMAASMTLDLGNTDKLNLFRQELQRLQVPLLPPDINRSESVFSVEARDGEAGEAQAIRYALGALKNVGAAAMRELVRERADSGPYRDLGDLVARLDPKQVNKRSLESLAAAGAFDSLLDNRRQLFEGAEILVRYAAAAVEQRSSAQNNLFGGEAMAAPSPKLPDVADWPGLERLQREFEAIGFYLSAHPLDSYGSSLKRLGVVQQSELARVARLDPGRRKVAGIVVGKQERRAKSGNRFAFLQLSDPSGVFEVVLFAETLARSREVLESGQPLLLTVDLRSEGDGLRLTAQQVEPLDQAAADAAQGIKVFVNSAETLPALQSLLERQGPGRGRVALVLDLAQGEELEFDLGGRFALTADGRRAMKNLPGLVVEDL